MVGTGSGGINETRLRKGSVSDDLYVRSPVPVIMVGSRIRTPTKNFRKRKARSAEQTYHYLYHQNKENENSSPNIQYPTQQSSEHERHACTDANGADKANQLDKSAERNRSRSTSPERLPEFEDTAPNWSGADDDEVDEDSSFGEPLSRISSPGHPGRTLSSES